MGAPWRSGSSFSFRKLAIGVLLFNASGGILYAILPLFEFERPGGGAFLATLIVGVPLIASTLGTFLWGALSDRWGRRRELLATGVLAQSVLFLLFPFLTPWGLLSVRVLQAFLGASVALATAVATEDPSRTAGSGLGTLSLWGSLGSMVGTAVGLPFISVPQFTLHSTSALLLFVLLGAFSAVSVLFLLGTGELPRRRSMVGRKDLLHFRDGRTILLLCVATAVVGGANYVVYTLFPLWVRWELTPQHFWGPAVSATEDLALLSIGASMGGVLVSLWAGRAAEDGKDRRWLYVVAPVLYCFLWLGLAFIHYYPVDFLIWAIPGYVLLSIPILREIAGRTDPEERGRAVGLWNASFSSGGLVGTLVAGLAYSGPPSFARLFVLAAAVDLAAAVGFVSIPTSGSGSQGTATGLATPPQDA